MAYVKMNQMKINRLEKGAIEALEKTAEALHTEIVQAQVMPFDTGNLQNESTFVDFSESSRGRVTINTSTPYARRLYYHPEYNFSKEENPGARGKWLDDWISGKKKTRAKAIYERLYKKEAGV